ncbi:hypothetical protein HXY33_08265 [Candidatus Bathyarchaeota archaeon]|nr:hypothetical protein [Candidatus Bathyarchaeota archaeon]
MKTATASFIPKGESDKSAEVDEDNTPASIHRRKKRFLWVLVSEKEAKTAETIIETEYVN